MEREPAGREPIRREIAVEMDRERLSLTLADHGMCVWLRHSDWPHAFPIPVTDEDWPTVRDAIESIRTEALRRAKTENAFQQLVDPIDGPDGEA